MKGNYETMERLIEEVRRMDEQKHDVIADTRRLRFLEAGQKDVRPDAPVNEDELVIEGDGGYALTSVATGQVVDHVGIPRKYADTARRIPGLLATNVNAWFQEVPQKRLVRTYRPNTGRAFLADNFRPMDNLWALNAVMPVLAEHKDMKVMSRSLGEKRMYLQVMFENMVAEVSRGDPVAWGLNFANSEIGFSAATVEFMIWNLRCTNGAVGGSVLRRVHLGGHMEEGQDIWKDDTVVANMKALGLMARDAVAAAVDQAKFLQTVEAMRTAKGDKAENPMVAIKNLPRVFGLTEAQAGIVVQDVTMHGDWSRYGIAQGLTFLAQQIDNRDRAYELEKTGYELMTSGSGWGEVLKAPRGAQN